MEYMTWFRPMLGLLGVGLLTVGTATGQGAPGPFVFDAADRTVEAVRFENPEWYDATIATGREGPWLTWLEFVPGEGDHVWVGRAQGSGWAARKRITAEPGQFANPTMSMDRDGGAGWLSYEAASAGQWDVFVSRVRDLEQVGPVRRVSVGDGPDIRHRTVADGKGGVWFVWQSGRDGQFDVTARHLTRDGMSEPKVVSASEVHGDWHPDVALTPDGTLHVVWDGFDGASFNVYLRSYRGDRWGDVVALAATPAFEGRTSIAAGPDGRSWVVWEEGGTNWGEPYTSRMRRLSQEHLEITDARGPLHRFRRLRMAMIDATGKVARLETELPMPSIDRAVARADRPPGVAALGAFYERGKLAVDGRGRVWLVYRQRYGPYIGLDKLTHVEADWGVYGRYLGADGWSELIRCDVGQGDGMQRLAIAPEDDGIALAWTTGRTDRRTSDRARGVAWARLTGSGEPPGAVATTAIEITPPPPTSAARPRRVRPPPAQVGGKTYRLFFGDLHRHTDLSLCYAPTDGTMDDAYRYGIDVVAYDFLGITDHSRDIAMGNPLSQLWWRSVKNVTRHALAPNFHPMFAYERSRGGEDHNVISLRSDMLRPHTYPHPTFWEELDDDTITIPHQTITAPIPEGGPQPLGLTVKTWEVGNDRARPLLEIYQGCRDRSIELDAHEALRRRNRLGFIASSDHLSTAHSFACVWAEQSTRESIFRAMQARRTFGATAKIRLVVAAGDHWMGESFTAQSIPPLRIEADTTAPIASIDVIVDGETVETLEPTGREVSLAYAPTVRTAGLHYVYVRLRQTDGHQAWSSPIFVQIEPPDGPN